MSLTVIQPRQPDPILPMSWLEWRREGDDEYAGGAYRIRLIEPYRWEVLHGGRHLFYDRSLNSSLTRADHHYRDGLRRRDLMMWFTLFVASIGLAALVETTRETLELWGVPLLALAMYGSVSAVVRFYAAWTRNRFDPYRRRAPWESRGWWQK